MTALGSVHAIGRPYSYTPVLAPSAGTFTATTCTGSWSWVGDLIFVAIDCTITTIGTGAGTVSVTLPKAPTSLYAQTLPGHELGVTGDMVYAALNGSATVNIMDYQGAAIIGNGYRFVLTGLYRP